MPFLLKKFSLSILLILALFAVASIISTKPVEATITFKVEPTSGETSVINENTTSVRITFLGLDNNKTYELCADTPIGSACKNVGPSGNQIVLNNLCAVEGTLQDCGNDLLSHWFHGGETYKVTLIEKINVGGNEVKTPYPASFQVQPYIPKVDFSIVQTGLGKVTVTGCRHPFNNGNRNKYHVDASPSVDSVNSFFSLNVSCTSDGDSGGSGSQPIGPLKPNTSYTLTIKDDSGQQMAIITFKTDEDDNIIPGSISTSTSGGSGQNPCANGVCKTALGDIPTNPAAFASKILSVASGIAGGIALIIMVIGSIRVLTSSGDQQKLSGGREMIIAAVAGLLFLVLSVIILSFIGIDILGLEGFGRTLGP